MKNARSRHKRRFARRALYICALSELQTAHTQVVDAVLGGVGDWPVQKEGEDEEKGDVDKAARTCSRVGWRMCLGRQNIILKGYPDIWTVYNWLLMIVFNIVW